MSVSLELSDSAKIGSVLGRWQCPSTIARTRSPSVGMPLGTVKLSRIRPFCGRILLDQGLRINDLAVAAGGENAAKLLNLTVPSLYPRSDLKQQGYGPRQSRSDV